jgi:outer membrane protein assembly factor BamB
VAAADQSAQPQPFPAPRSKKTIPPPQSKTTKVDSRPMALFPVRQLWTLDLNNQLTSPPAYDSTRVFFSIAGDRIVAYDLKSGAQQWIVSAQTEVQATAGDGLLFFVNDDGLTALHATDGSAAWQVPLPDTLLVPPIWDNGWLIVATSGGSVLTFRASDGKMIWKRDVGSRANAVPAIAADRVYVPTVDGRVVALRIETGAPLWERRLGGAANEILALDDRVYVGSRDNFFYCIKAQDGRVDWRWRTGGDIIGAPIADEDRVYFVALDNVLRALNRKSGVQLWIRSLPFRPAWGPTKAGATIVVAGQVPTLRAYHFETGAPAGEVPVGGEVAAAPRQIADAPNGIPMILVSVRDIARGASAALVARSIDPAVAPIAPLPNPITVSPAKP